MIAGFSGHLISEQFLEQKLASCERQPSSRSLALEVGRCRSRQLLLGPASSLRALVDSGAAPLMDVLGFDSIADRDFHDHAAVATVRGQGAVATLVVTRW